MNNVMTSSFCELNENEMMTVDGGFDGAMWKNGFFQAIGGIVGIGEGAANVVANPNPINKVLGVGAVASGAYSYYKGAQDMYNAFLH